MTRNPLINALAATVYIVAIVFVMHYDSRFVFHYGTESMEPEPSLIAPIAFICLFTLSAAVMGYLFLYQPIQLFLDGERKVGVNLFLQTVAVFAGITAVVLVLLFSGVLA